MADMVNHPEHYNQNGVETIDVIEAALTPEEFRGFLKGNVMKYLDRHEFKNGQQDLEKAQWYTLKLILTEGFDAEYKHYYEPMIDLYNDDFTDAIKHWEEYRNELSKDL